MISTTVYETSLGVARATLDLDLRILILNGIHARLQDVLVVDIHELDLTRPEVQPDRTTETSAVEIDTTGQTGRDHVISNADLCSACLPIRRAARWVAPSSCAVLKPLEFPRFSCTGGWLVA